MKLVDVPEYGKARLDSLSREQRDALLSCGGDLSLAPEPGSDSAWVLRTGSQIGTVVCAGLTVRIRPKLTIARLFVMLSAASGAICWDERYIGLDASSTVEDVVAMVFVDSVRRALASGLLRGYVAVEEESMVVRGRLEFAETIRRRPLTLIPLVQTPEFLDCDTPENQILATALVHLASPTALSHRDDVYQCLAYAAATGLPSITLFYAGDQSAARDIAIADGRTRVLVRTINLAAPIEQLRAQCASLAVEVAGGGVKTS